MTIKIKSKFYLGSIIIFTLLSSCSLPLASNNYNNKATLTDSFVLYISDFLSSQIRKINKNVTVYN